MENVVKPNDYKMTNGVWKKYYPSRFHRMELHQIINKLIWKRVDEQNQETPEEKNRREELFRVIEMQKHLFKTTETIKGPVKQLQQTKRTITEKKPHPTIRTTQLTYQP